MRKRRRDEDQEQDEDVDAVERERHGAARGDCTCDLPARCERRMAGEALAARAQVGETRRAADRGYAHRGAAVGRSRPTTIVASKTYG